MWTAANIDTDDYELAELALKVTDTKPGASTIPAILVLKNECGWSLAKAKAVIDFIQIGQGRK